MIILIILIIVVIGFAAGPVDSFRSPDDQYNPAIHLQLSQGQRQRGTEGGDISPDRFLISRERYLPPQRIENREFSTPLSAQSAVVVDLASNEILFAKNIDAQRAIASITKLMSAMVVIDTSPDWDALVTITQDDMRLGREYVSAGEQLSVRQLFFASLVGSSNTATVALARSTGLPDKEFAARMNQKAKVMGLVQTTFVEPTGLDAQNVSSARELAVLLRYALGYQDIAYATTQQSYRFANRTVYQTNWLLTGQVTRLSSAKLIGGKTGYIDSAGYNFATQYQQNNHIIAVIVLGADDHFARFTEADMLAAWSYDTYAWIGDPAYEYR